MNRTGLCFSLLLLGYVLGGKPSLKDVVFSRGIQLFVEGLNPSDPSVLILSSFGSDPGASHTPMLVCVLSGLHTHLVDIIWWINNTVVTPENNVVWSSRGSDGTRGLAELFLKHPVTFCLLEKDPGTHSWKVKEDLSSIFSHCRTTMLME
ncbi:hypothetical protein J4Q44_G00158230 [Coregonus suidteri]|uniref:Ig-like domain-containing protein n=1 Tax=Coregonus suidteri TaxID=861788 RepID=A0AAN8LQS9_9TELE